MIVGFEPRASCKLMFCHWAIPTAFGFHFLFWEGISVSNPGCPGSYNPPTPTSCAVRSCFLWIFIYCPLCEHTHVCTCVLWAILGAFLKCSHIFLSVISLLSVVVIKTSWPKAAWGGKGLFVLQVRITVHPQGKPRQRLKQDKNLESGTEVEDMEKSCLLAVPRGLLNPLFPTVGLHFTFAYSKHLNHSFPLSFFPSLFPSPPPSLPYSLAPTLSFLLLFLLPSLPLFP